MKHRRRKSSRMGREFMKPTDQRRKGVVQDKEHLSMLTLNQLRRRGKVKEYQVKVISEENEGIQVLYRILRVNILLKGQETPRTITITERG